MTKTRVSGGWLYELYVFWRRSERRRPGSGCIPRTRSSVGRRKPTESTPRASSNPTPLQCTHARTTQATVRLKFILLASASIERFFSAPISKLYLCSPRERPYFLPNARRPAPPSLAIPSQSVNQPTVRSKSKSFEVSEGAPEM